VRRRIGVLVAVFALVGVASGCSLREVQLWFAINKQQNISRADAKNLADLVNSKKAPGGCDGNYAGTCVPDNATQVHCAGAPGEGPAVRGPFTIAGWDSFELDPDGDKHVCDSPVGSFDVFGQNLGGIRIAGWAFDPNTTDPIDLVVSTNGFIDQIPADGSRGDLAAALPGVGANHGFDLNGDGWDPGDQVSICVVALNVGTGSNTTLGCKNIVIREIGDQILNEGTPQEIEYLGLIEGADVVPGGVRIRGFAFDDANGGAVIFSTFTAQNGTAPEPGQAHAVVRDDINTIFSLPSDAASGFDFVMPAAKVGLSNYICLNSQATQQPTQIMCRTIGS
jgi:hypothetical protein